MSFFNGPRSLIETLKSIPWLVKKVRTWRTWQGKRRALAWMRARIQEGCNLDLRLELTGLMDGYRHIHLDHAYIEKDVTIWISHYEGSDPQLFLGRGTFLGQNVYVGVHHPIRMGANVMIGAYSYLISANHRFARRDIPMQQQGFEGAPIVIEDEAWLGTHVVVLPGITIGRGAIIGAGSVVTRDVPAWEIWGGTPAHFIKVRPG